MTFTCPALFRRLMILAFVVSCAACAPKVVKEETPPPPVAEEAAPAAPEPVPLDPAQLELAAGIESYENGSYKPAAKQLQNALGLGLKVQAEQATAHKYLAFMLCVGKRTTACRAEFRKAMAADPSFDLTPAESGHPVWGPVFRKLKTDAAKAAKAAEAKASKSSKKPAAK